MKRIILSVMALAAAGVATAQEAYSLWSVTPKAGLTVASVVGDDVERCSSSVSWAAGVEASLRPGRLLSFDFGLFYTRDRIKKDVQGHSPGPTIDFTLTRPRLVTERLDIPLMAGLHVLPGLTLKAGIQPSLLMSARAKYHLSGFTRGLEPMHTYTDEDIAKLPKTPFERDGDMGVKGRMYDFDLCVPIGASYEWRNIVLDARYHFGLYSIAKEEDERLDVKRRYLLLTLGYRFSL